MQKNLILIVGIMCLVLGTYSLFIERQAISQPIQVPPTSNSTNIIIYNGSQEGVGLGTVQKGQTITVTHIGGKIISNTETGWSSPIWGVPQNETDPGWVKGLPYKELNTDAVFIEINGQRIPFRKGQSSVSATASVTSEVRLKMNDSRYWENAGDARFQVTLSSIASNSVITVPLSTPWTSTNIVVKSGQQITITASGRGVWKNVTATNPNAYPKAYEECDPNGTPPVDSKDYYSNISSYLVKDAYKGALIGKIGEYGTPFKIGSQFNLKVSGNGILFLGINDMKPEVDSSSFADNSGSFSANVEVK